MDFCFSGVYLKITPEIEQLLIKDFANYDDLAEEDIISEQINNIGGIKFCPSQDALRITPISNEGKIDWNESQMLYDYENFLYISFDNDNDLRKAWLEPNQTLKDKIKEDEAFDFIPDNLVDELHLEFYWVEAYTYDD